MRIFGQDTDTSDGFHSLQFRETTDKQAYISISCASATVHWYFRHRYFYTSCPQNWLRVLISTSLSSATLRC